MSLGSCRRPAPQQVHIRYILALTCGYLVVYDARPRVHGADRPHPGPDARGMPEHTSGWLQSRRHYGVMAGRAVHASASITLYGANAQRGQNLEHARSQ